MGSLHKNIIEDDVHADVARIYADNTARDADTSFNTASTNFNKNVRVDSPLSIYKLMSSGTFLELSNTGAGSGNVTTSDTLTNNFLVRGNGGEDIDISSPDDVAGLFTSNDGTQLVAKALGTAPTGYTLQNSAGVFKGLLVYDSISDTTRIESGTDLELRVTSAANKILITKTVGTASDAVLLITNTLVPASSNIFLGVNSPQGSITGVPGDLFYREAGYDSGIYSQRGIGSNNSSWSKIETSYTASENPFGGFGQVENIIRFSESLSNAAWIKSNVTVTADNAVAPNGTMTADQLAWDTSGGSVDQTLFNLAGSTEYTVSFWGQHVSDADEIVFNLVGDTKTIKFDTTFRKYSFQLTTGGGASIFLMGVPASVGTFNLWGLQIVLGTPALGREHFPYAKTAFDQIFPLKGPGLISNDPLYLGSSTIHVHPEEGSNTAELKILPPPGTKNTKLILQTDSATDLLILESDHVGPLNNAKISTSNSFDTMLIESGSITLSAINTNGQIGFFNTGTGAIFEFNRNAGQDGNPLVQWVQGGTNPANPRWFFGDRDPQNNVSAQPGDFYYRDSTTTSSLYVNRGVSTNSNGWVEFATGVGAGDVVGPAGVTADSNIAIYNGTTGKIIKDSTVLLSSLGNVNTSDVLTNNFLVRGNGTTDIDVVTSDDVHGIFVNDNSMLLTIRPAAVGLTGYTLQDIAGVQKGAFEYDVTPDTLLLTASSGTDFRLQTAVDQEFRISGATNKFIFNKSMGAFTNAVIGIVNGAAAAEIDIFVGTPTPQGGVTGIPGDIYIRDEGEDSGIYINIGNMTTPNNDFWTKLETSFMASDNPFGGFGQIHNLIVHSEALDNVLWVKSSVIVTPNSLIAPNGEMTGDAVFFSNSPATLTQTIQNSNLLPSTEYTVSFWGRFSSGNNILDFTLKGSATKTIAFDFMTHKYSFQLTTDSVGADDLVISVNGLQGNFELWGFQVSQGVPTQDRENFPYIRTEVSPVIPKGPGLAINDDIIFGSLVRLQSPNGTSADLALRPPTSIDITNFKIQDDSGVDVFEIKSDTTNPTKVITLRVPGTGDALFIESDMMMFSAVAEMDFETQGIEQFNFKRILGNDTDPVMSLDQDGTNPGNTNIFLGDRTPIGNVSGEPADLYITKNGISSAFFIHKGVGADNTSWFELGSGNVTSSDTLTDNFLLRGNGGSDIDLIGLGTSGIFTNGIGSELTIRPPAATLSAAYRIQDDGGVEIFSIESSTSGVINQITIRTTSTSDILEINGGELQIQANTGSMLLTVNTSMDFLFDRPTGDDTDAMFRILQSGTNPSAIAQFFGNRTPIGNIDANPGDVHFQDNLQNSAISIHKGTVSNSADWFALETVPDKIEFSSTTTTDALGNTRIYACTDTTASRTLTISNSLIALGTPGRPHRFTVKDATGNAGTGGFGILILVESGNIDGDSLISIDRDNGALDFYTDGTDIFVEKDYFPPTASVVFSGNQFDASIDTANPSSIAFNNEGTRMYALDVTTDDVFQFDLTVPFSMATENVAPPTVTFDASPEVTAGTSLSFNNIGTKMFILDQGTDNVFEYDLGTAFDLSTASYSGFSFNVAAQDGTGKSLIWTADGLGFFMMGDSTNFVYEYDLTTAFSLQTGVSFSGNSFSVTTEENEGESIAFSSDGTKLFLSGDQNQSVLQYDLGSPFTLSAGATFIDRTFSLTPQNASFEPRSIAWSANGKKMFILDSNNPNEAVYEYDVYPPFSLKGTDILP